MSDVTRISLICCENQNVKKRFRSQNVMSYYSLIETVHYYCYLVVDLNVVLHNRTLADN